MGPFSTRPPLDPLLDCLHCRVSLSVPIASHLADCPLRATAAEGAERLFELREPLSVLTPGVIVTQPPVDRRAPFPVNGVHFIGWDQHAQRGRPVEAEDTTDSNGSW